MPVVYRVESDEGSGPYESGILLDGGFVAGYSEDHPSPCYNWMEDGSLFYAFHSMDLLFTWFDNVMADDNPLPHCDWELHQSSVYEWLEYHNFAVYVYSVNDEDCYTDRKQCAFKKEKAKMIEVLCFNDARNLLESEAA